MNRRSFIHQSAIGSIILSLTGKEIYAKPHDMSSFDLFETIKNRRSVRKFKSTPVPKEHLTKILEAANYAPSPRNRQAWKFLVVQDRKLLNKIKEECIKVSGEQTRQYFTDYLSAPVYVVVIANKKTRNPINDVLGGTLAAENLMLAARALGYGTVFATNSIPEKITKEVLNIPEEYQRVCITPIGVPVEWPKTPTKKNVEDVIVYNKF